MKTNDFWHVYVPPLLFDCRSNTADDLCVHRQYEPIQIIKFHKHHQTALAEALMNRTFQFSESQPALGCLQELFHIGMPNSCFDRRHYSLERIGRCDAEPFNLNITDYHFPFSHRSK